MENDARDTKIEELEKRITQLESFIMSVGPGSQFSFIVNDKSILGVINDLIMRTIQQYGEKMDALTLLEIVRAYKGLNNGQHSVSVDSKPISQIVRDEITRVFSEM